MPQRCTSYKRVFSSALGRYVKRCKTLKGTKRRSSLSGLGRAKSRKRKPANKGKKCKRFGRANGKKVCRSFGGVKTTRKRTRLGANKLRGEVTTCRQYAIYTQPDGRRVKRCRSFGPTRKKSHTRPVKRVRQSPRKPRTKYTYKSRYRKSPASVYGRKQKGGSYAKRRPLRGLSGSKKRGKCKRFKRVRVKGRGMQRRCAAYK